MPNLPPSQQNHPSLRVDQTALIELLTVIVIMGIVLTGIVGIYISGVRTQANLTASFQAQTSLHVGLDKMRKDVHLACSQTAQSATSPSALSEPHRRNGLDHLVHRSERDPVQPLPCRRHDVHRRLGSRRLPDRELDLQLHRPERHRGQQRAPAAPHPGHLNQSTRRRRTCTTGYQSTTWCSATACGSSVSGRSSSPKLTSRQ